MSRYIKRVPLDFAAPIGAAYRPSHEPPSGEGWQLWQGVSDGPISPVFETAEALIDWMTRPVPENERPSSDPAPYPANPWAQGWTRAAAEMLVRDRGWMPSGRIAVGPTGARSLSAEEMLRAMGTDK